MKSCQNSNSCLLVLQYWIDLYKTVNPTGTEIWRQSQVQALGQRGWSLLESNQRQQRWSAWTSKDLRPQLWWVFLAREQVLRIPLVAATATLPRLVVFSLCEPVWYVHIFNCSAYESFLTVSFSGRIRFLWWMFSRVSQLHHTLHQPQKGPEDPSNKKRPKKSDNLIKS